MCAIHKTPLNGAGDCFYCQHPDQLPKLDKLYSQAEADALIAGALGAAWEKLIAFLVVKGCLGAVGILKRDMGSFDSLTPAAAHLALEERVAAELRRERLQEIVKHSMSADQLAQKFHESYERLAPSFGYETRKASSVPWDQVPAANKSLMVAVCSEILPTQTDDQAEQEAKLIADTRLAALDEARMHVSLFMPVNDDEAHYQRSVLAILEGLAAHRAAVQGCASRDDS